MWLLPFAVVAAVAVDVVSARRIDGAFLEARRGAAAELLGVRTRPFELEPASNATRVWLFGESSFAAPDLQQVPMRLRAHAEARGETLVVDNLASEGFTSADILQRVQEALRAAEAAGVQPDIAVLYAGHNDVTTTFHAAMGFPAADPWGFPASALVAAPYYLAGGVWRDAPGLQGFRFYRNRFVGGLLRRYQQAGWVHFQAEDFAPLRAEIEANYAPRIRQMAGALAARGVPLMVMTPIGAIAVRPEGPIQVIDPLFDAASRASSRAERVAAWLAARDAETFTSDMRAKSFMLEALRQLGPDAKGGPAPISVCDLERGLAATDFPFDATMFEDPLHLSPAGFDVMVAFLDGCLDAQLHAARAEIVAAPASSAFDLAPSPR
jgi:lysophospholipase L1-like esterase